VPSELVTVSVDDGKLASATSMRDGTERSEARSESVLESLRARYLLYRGSPRVVAIRDRLSRSHRGLAVLLVGLVAALAYCSWPVGYLVNPSLAAGALASELEARGQPYSWLFILLDCATGAAALLVVRLSWPTRDSANISWRRAGLVSYGLFGLSTAIDAVIPVGCGNLPLNRCGVDLSRLNADDVLTAVAMVALFVAAVCVQVHATKDRSWSLSSVSSLVVLALWSACGLVFLAASFSYRPAIPLQHLTLALTSALVFVVPALSSRRRSRGEASEVRSNVDPLSKSRLGTTARATPTASDRAASRG
jgi:hypothetical protein